MFQVLYQRGIGTQLALLYINWANCYLRDNAFEQAEQVINLGFQGQAKPYEDLQSAQQQVQVAHRTQFQQQQHQQQHHQQQHQQQLQQQPQYAAVSHPNQSVTSVQTQQPHYDSSPDVYRNGSHNQYGCEKRKHEQHVEYAQHNQETLQQQQPSEQQQLRQPLKRPRNSLEYVYNNSNNNNSNGNDYVQNYNQTAVYQNQQQLAPQQCATEHGFMINSSNGNNQQQSQMYYDNENQKYQHPEEAQVQSQVTNTSHLELNGPQQQIALEVYAGQEISISHNNGNGDSLADSSTDLNNSGYVIASSLNFVYDMTTDEEVVVEEVKHLQQDSQAQYNHDHHHNQADRINLPLNFVHQSTNNQNFWRAPLFLAEPYDPNRCSMYVKEHVYPAVEGTDRCEYEISFEELLRDKYFKQRTVQEERQVSTPVHEKEAPVVEEDEDTYTEYWLEESQLDAANNEDGHDKDSITPHNNNNLTYATPSTVETAASYVDEFKRHLMATAAKSSHHQPAAALNLNESRKKPSSSKKKKRKQLIVQINDQEDEEDYDEIERSTIRYTSATSGTGNGAAEDNSRRITIKFRKEPPSTTGGSGGGGCSTSISKLAYARAIGSNGYGSASSSSISQTDADLLLGIGQQPNNSHRQAHQNPQTVTYQDDSSAGGYSEYNTSSFNSTGFYLGGENSNGTFTTMSSPSNITPVMSYNNNNINQQQQSCSSSTPRGLPGTSTSSSSRRLSKHRSNVSMLLNEDSMTMNENSFYQGELDEDVRSRRLQRALETIEENLSKPAVDPFNSQLCKAFLTQIGFPSAELCDAYRLVQTPLPKLSQTKQALIADTYYNVEKEVGRGAYGAVYKAVNAYSGETVAIKFQKPPNSWELYVCNEIRKRIQYHDIVSIAVKKGCVL